MTENDSSFKMGDIEKSPDKITNNDVVDIRKDKIKHRITLVNILIPFLMLVLLFYVYIEMKKKVDDVNLRGTENIQALSNRIDIKMKSMETNVASILEKYAEFEAATGEKISEGKKTTGSIHQKLIKIERSFKKIDSSKVDKKKLKENINKIEKSLSSIKKNVDKINSELIKNSELDKEFGLITNDLVKINTDIVSLSSLKIDKEALDLAVMKNSKESKDNLEKLRKDFEGRISSIFKRIKKLETTMYSKQIPYNVSGVKSNPDKNIHEKNSLQKDQEDKENSNKGSNIEEQDIIE